ncbi:conserved hypothetical protein [Theileria orientalis strain Shintoku]|uniref:Uncharacterized protein n=1 Tax=Theileria orientalis strain Shintoku TaxID=869250 RepID=J4DQ75_THEOR|nr:conserved hypothetical protein [Theileria orientalis strain Shintoku]PVC50065.1 hypothetical protein MACL_00002560 [Theileria orientalis]BAM41964.1 conserved hypothetical protein [Theileria orientalis strain Shintoku]|eukprot:XP_009692265.1 conserved hypothetical protein [Theileria orientalis strain Shintoku]
MLFYRYLIAVVSSLLIGTIKPTDAIKCHPYYRVCVQNCKVKHGGNIFLKNMCVGGCKFSQCVIKRTDDNLSLER